MEINSYSLLFVLWNIFLALLPCWAVYFLSEHAVGTRHGASLRHGFLFTLIFLFWIFMLPNTAYLFLMVRHLVDYCVDYDIYRVCQTGSWMVMFFFTNALIGLPTFYYALSQMTKLLRRNWFPILIIPLTSIGLMLGLYERFNSWDILRRPITLIETTASYFQTPFLFNDFLVFTIALYLIYYITNFFWQWRS